MAVINTDRYGEITDLYASAIRQMAGVADYYLQAATIVLLLDDFAPELDLLKPFYQAYLNATTAYSGYSSGVVDAVRSLQAHVLSNAIDPATTTYYTDVNDWYDDESLTVEQEFADISQVAGYTIESAYIN